MKTRRTERRVSIKLDKQKPRKRKRCRIQEEVLFQINKRTRDYEIEEQSQVQKVENPQLDLLFKNAPYYEGSMPVPYELLLKIFRFLVEISDNPIRDLCNIARVCESWRLIVMQTQTHHSLWTRVDLTKIPLSTGNFSSLSKIFANSESFKYVKEVAFKGVVQSKHTRTTQLLEELITAPNLKTLSISEFSQDNRNIITSTVLRALPRCRSIQNLSITNSRRLFQNVKWFNDFLIENGHQLRELDLAMSMAMIPPILLRLLNNEFCPNLKILDLSTCDAVCTHSFDAIQLAQNLPGLQVLRVGNVSFKRIEEKPPVNYLTELRELSMPTGIPDSARDDALFATLTYGSMSITTLDVRGSTISPTALIDSPSRAVKEFHMDDLCPSLRGMYHRVIKEWRSSLEVLSLVKINHEGTMSQCLKALYEDDQVPLIRDIDLSNTDVIADDLKNFLRSAKHLVSINLTTCRSLPRGCRGKYSKTPNDQTTQPLRELMSKLN